MTFFQMSGVGLRITEQTLILIVIAIFLYIISRVLKAARKYGFIADLMKYASIVILVVIIVQAFFVRTTF